MKTITKFFLALTLLLMGRLFDMYSTYLYIPDLKGETNIIVSWFGASWTPVIIIHSLIVLFLTYALYYYYFKFQSVVPTDKNLTLQQYVSFFHFNRPDYFKQCFYKLPTNVGSFLASLGYVVPWTLIFISFIVGTSTSFLMISESYKTFYRNGGVKTLFILMPLIATYFYIKFFRDQYKHYRQDTEI